MKIEKLKLYDHRDDVVLTTYLWDDEKELLNGGKRPAILICPGGGYLTCSAREAEPVAIRFAAMGYHAFVLQYSVYDEGGSAPIDYSKPLPSKEQCQYPHQIQEIAKSMLIIQEHAQEWCVDTDRIGLCGFSSGAHNCAMYAISYNTPIITDHVQDDVEKLKPATVILCYVVSDYVYLQEEAKRDSMAKRLFDLSLQAYLGHADEEALHQISPVFHVQEDTPPMFLWATATDETVSVVHSIHMANALARKKVPFELHIFEEGQHGLSLANQTSAEAISQQNEAVANWINLVEPWLQKRFALALPNLTAMEAYMASRQSSLKQ